MSDLFDVLKPVEIRALVMALVERLGGEVAFTTDDVARSMTRALDSDVDVQLWSYDPPYPCAMRLVTRSAAVLTGEVVDA